MNARRVRGNLGLTKVNKLGKLANVELNNYEVAPIIRDLAANFTDNEQFNGFNRNKKAIFLDLFSKSPNFTGCAQAVGNDKTTVWYSLQRDPEFNKAFELIKEGLTDQLESKVYEYGQRPTNFLDRIAWLKARRPDVWNPERKVTIDMNVNHLTQAIDKAGALDAELVSKAREAAQLSVGATLPAPLSSTPTTPDEP